MSTNVFTLQAGKRTLRVDYVQGVWIVWLTHDPLYKCGTTLELYPDGKIVSMTTYSDGRQEERIIRDGAGIGGK